MLAFGVWACLDLGFGNLDCAIWILDVEFRFPSF